MNRRLPNCSENRFGPGDVRAMYVDAFFNRAITLPFAKAVLKQFHLKVEDYFCIPSLEAQIRVLDAANPARSPCGVPDAEVCDDSVDGVLNVDDY